MGLSKLSLRAKLIIGFTVLNILILITSVFSVLTTNSNIDASYNVSMILGKSYNRVMNTQKALEKFDVYTIEFLTDDSGRIPNEEFMKVSSDMIEEIAKPITLAFRLFGNILAGEILIIVLLKLMPIWMPIPSVCWLAFSIFIGGGQAFIFTMLSMAYLANAVKSEEEG